MTIALGIVAHDGIVLAADMQESDGYFKEYALKITAASTHTRIESTVRSSVAITGAGAAIHLDAIADEIVRGFEANQFTELRDFETYLAGTVEQFYKTHVAAIAPQVDRDFKLIVGAQIEGNSGLWVSDATVIKQVVLVEAVGTGSPFAKMAMGTRLIVPDVELAAMLAILGVMRAKEFDINCGNGTYVLCLRDNATYRVPWYRVEEVEKLFHRYSGIEYSAFQYATGHQLTSEDQQTAKIGQWLTELREDFKKASKENLKHT